LKNIICSTWVRVTYLVLILTFSSHASSAQKAGHKKVETKTTATKVEKTETVEVKKEIVTDEGPEMVPYVPTEPLQKRPINRLVSPVAVGYSLAPLGFAIPLKHGPFFTWSTDPTWSFEVSYLQGSIGFSTPWIDLGSFDESFVNFSARYFVGSSFNWIFGLSRQAYDAHLGNAIMSRITSGRTDVDLIHVATLGVQVGLGNRWQLNNGLILGADWLVLNFPIATLRSDVPALDVITDPGDHQRVEDAMRFMRYLPSAVLLKFSVGYSF
jgi:hypothetical protein